LRFIGKGLSSILSASLIDDLGIDRGSTRRGSGQGSHVEHDLWIVDQSSY